jgi:hypothetical protein
MGESSLASAYAKPPARVTASPRSPELLLSPTESILMAPDEDIDPPMPPASQNQMPRERDEEEEDDENDEEAEPFQFWGGSRAEGSLPWKRSADDQRGRKRIRSEWSSARDWC